MGRTMKKAMGKTLDREATCQLICDTCKKKKITVEVIISKMNVSTQTVYSWFSGKRMPTVDHLVELAAILDVSVNELIVEREFECDEY